MNDLRDAPRSLRMNVFAIDLAEQIYVSQVGVYGGADWSWSGLSPETKARYMQLAAQLLQGLAPGNGPTPLFDVAAHLAREHAAQVIGRIAPNEPFGISRND